MPSQADAYASSRLFDKRCVCPPVTQTSICGPSIVVWNTFSWLYICLFGACRIWCFWWKIVTKRLCDSNLVLFCDPVMEIWWVGWCDAFMDSICLPSRHTNITPQTFYHSRPLIRSALTKFIVFNFTHLACISGIEQLSKNHNKPVSAMQCLESHSRTLVLIHPIWPLFSRL